MSDCRIALEMGFRSVWESFRSGRAQKPHTSPTTPARALKKNIRGELNTNRVFGALREKSTKVPVGGCLKQDMASRREKKREKKRVLGQDQESVKLDMRQTIVESCALDE